MRPGREPRNIKNSADTYAGARYASMRPGREPRNIAMCSGVTLKAPSGFNEAGAGAPEHHGPFRCSSRPSARFNEAGAGAPEHLHRLVEMVRAVHASMRPGREPRNI